MSTKNNSDNHILLKSTNESKNENNLKIKELKSSYESLLQKITKPELEILRLHHIYNFTHNLLYPTYKIDKALLPELLISIPENINIINKGNVLTRNTLLAIGYTYNLAYTGKNLTINELIKLKIFISDGSISINYININSTNLDCINSLSSKDLSNIYSILQNLNNITTKIDDYYLDDFIKQYIIKLLFQINELSTLLNFEVEPTFLLNYWLLKNNLPTLDLEYLDLNYLDYINTQKRKTTNNKFIILCNKNKNKNKNKNIFNNSINDIINKKLYDYSYKIKQILIDLNSKYVEFSNNTPTNPHIFKKVFDFDLLSQKNSINSWYIKRASYDLDYFTINDFFGDDNQGKGFTKEFKNAIATKSNFSDWSYGDEIPELPQNLFDSRELVDFNAYLDVLNYKAFNTSYTYTLTVSNIKQQHFKARYRTLIENLILLFRQKELSIRHLEFSEPDELGLQVATLTIVSSGECPNQHSFSFKSFNRKFPVESEVSIIKS